MFINRNSKLKKLLAVLVALVVIGTASFSYGWVGVAVRVIATAWSKVPPFQRAQLASATIHAVGIAGCYIYSLASSGSGSHKADGTNIKRTGEVTWIDIADGTTVKQHDVTVRTSTEAMKNAAKNNPTKYPLLAEKAQHENNVNDANEVGKVWRMDENTKYKVTSVAWTSKSVPQGTDWATLYNYHDYTYNTTMHKHYYAIPTTHSNPPGYVDIMCATSTMTSDSVGVEESTPEQFAEAIRNGAPENVYSDYYGEIDDYIKSNPNVLHFEDPVTGETAVPEYASKAVQASKAAERNVDAAQAAATAAETAATNARARANANPTDNYLANMADQAEAAAAAAEQKLQQAQQEAAALEHALEDERGSSGVAADGDHAAYAVDGEHDFGARLTSFFNTIKNSTLFSLPGNIMGTVPTGGNPVQTVDMGTTFGSHSIDWSRFSAIWAILKTCFLICMGVVSMKIITKGGGG